ncbi:MAG: fatty acid desaturase [Chitinophagaceae bacterium]
MEKVAKLTFAKPAEDHIFNSIRQRVNAKVKELQPTRQLFITIKAILFPLLYIVAYTIALIYGTLPLVLYTCYLCMGVLLVIIFLNLIHEAVHHTLFRKNWLNQLYIYFFDLMGANSYVWKIRHTRLHHNYPNIMGWDSDIEQSQLARVFPHGSFSAYHRYQHIYLPLLYPFFLLNWLLVRDFKDYFNKNKIVWKVVSIPGVEYVKLFIWKTFFLFYIVVLPRLLLGITWLQMLGAFCVMIFAAGIFALLVLITPHANIESEFPLPNENNAMQQTWFMHQLQNTNDVNEDNWFTRFFMGCFNYHIAHHLFPNVHHVFYPDITAIIREEAEKHHLPYKSYPLVTALHNHYKLLKQNRQPEDLFEETM